MSLDVVIGPMFSGNMGPVSVILGRGGSGSSISCGAGLFDPLFEPLLSTVRALFCATEPSARTRVRRRRRRPRATAASATGAALIDASCVGLGLVQPSSSGAAIPTPTPTATASAIRAHNLRQSRVVERVR